MKTSDITDEMVLQAYIERDKSDWKKEVIDILEEKTGCHWKVCWRAMERASDRKLLDYGTSLRSGWITDKGKELIK